MASLIKAFPVKHFICGRPAVIYNVTKKYKHYFLEELVPGPYPKTKQEREAAAKKYGLLPHEYEPYPDDGFGHGDYPKLPDISGDTRGPWRPWDYADQRRDYNEVWHSDHDLFHMDRIDINEKYPRPLWQMWLIYIGMMGSLWLLMQFFEDYKIGCHVMKKQYIVDRTPEKRHYTFEPASVD